MKFPDFNPTEEYLKTETTKGLNYICNKLDISNYSRMTKAEKIDLIIKNQKK